MTLSTGGASSVGTGLRRANAPTGARPAKQGPRASEGNDGAGARARVTFSGAIESVDAEGIDGWVAGAEEGGGAPGFMLKLDGRRIYAGEAALPRPDLEPKPGLGTPMGFRVRWRDLLPQEPLAEPAHRLGRLTLQTSESTMPAFGPDPCSVDLYACIEPYFDRLAYVLGTAEVAPAPSGDDTSLVADYFDAGFYLCMYPDAVDHADEALAHFMTTGWREGHDPNPDFSCRYYISANPDIQTHGLNPFVHYLRSGRFEGRLPRQPGGYRTDVLRQLQSLGDTVRAWKRSDALRVLSSAMLLQGIRKQLGGLRPRGLVLSVSHDDYTTNVGGVQLCLAIEQRAFNDRAQAYLHVSPWQASPLMFGGSDPQRVPLRLLCNGVEIGHATAEELCLALDELRDDLTEVPATLVVHALHGHAPEAVAAMWKALRGDKAVYWLHDFFSLCNGHNLLRNQVSFCGAPPIGSTACTVCVNGEARQAHTQRVRALFESVPFAAVSPSAHTADLWRSRSELPVEDTIVHGHCRVIHEGWRLSADEAVDAPRAMATQRPVRVAYLGHPTTHKGWPVFCELVRQTCGLGRYEFWHLGTAPDPALPIRFAEVRVSPRTPDAMIRALDQAGIDVVVQWSIWPETFGIAARESVAAGAYMVVSAASGAVAEFVRAESAGEVLETEGELLELFRSGRIVQVVQARSQRGVPVGRLEWSSLSLDIVAGTEPATRPTPIASE